MEAAAKRAFKGHEWKSEVREFRSDFKARCAELYAALKDGSWKRFIRYREMDKTNNNGKVRHIKCPSLETRIYQLQMLDKLEPIYAEKDNLNGLNCKKGCGITASDHRKSVLRKLKHLYYDRLDLQYCLVIDQRKCYEHIRPKAARKALKKILDDPWMVDFAVDVSFVDGELPIGTPASPFIHHLLMLSFDYLAKEISAFSVRYADDNYLAFYTKEEAQAAKWRIKNHWWYELGIRAKRHTITIRPLSEPLDLCGYVLHRNVKGVTEHDKGYVSVRRSTVERAKRCRTDGSWASYFGLMRHADVYALMVKIEQKMKLRDLTSKIRIDREMDAPHIDIKELVGRPVTIYKYEMRYNGQKEANWIKCLVGYDETTDGEKTGRTLAREFHGNYQGIIRFLIAAEKAYGKELLLPLEEVEIENQCGYIFKDSTNQIKYIEDGIN